MTTTPARVIYPELPDPLTLRDLQQLFSPSFESSQNRRQLKLRIRDILIASLAIWEVVMRMIIEARIEGDVLPSHSQRIAEHS